MLATYASVPAFLCSSFYQEQLFLLSPPPRTGGGVKSFNTRGGALRNTFLLQLTRKHSLLEPPFHKLGGDSSTLLTTLQCLLEAHPSFFIDVIAIWRLNVPRAHELSNPKKETLATHLYNSPKIFCSMKQSFSNANHSIHIIVVEARSKHALRVRLNL